MLIDAEKLMARQLGLENQTDITFDDGRRTILTPVAYVPQLDDPALVLPLDGDWRVTRWPFTAAESALASATVDDRAWPVARQPGKVFYLDTTITCDQVPKWDRVGLKHIHPEDGALLRREARLPRAWRGKRIYLRFDAIYPAGRVYLNGELLGEHTSGLTPVEWDVTGKVTPGRKAVVAVRLLRTHKFVQMDMPRHAIEFAGLAQSACFHATEPCQLSDYHLISELDPSLRTGRLTGTVTLRNRNAAGVAGTLAVTLTEGGKRRAANRAVRVAAGATVCLPVELTLAEPRLWNDEYPNLYTVALTLKAAGQTPQTIRYRTGFRRFEFRNSRPFLNGHPVKFRGVNHLTYHPEFGMYTPEDWLRQNLSLMKKANVNTIRTHFLGPRCLAALCDELGIYLVQELPIDWGTHYIHDVEWVGPALQRIQAGILRDRHHPALMIWSVGNENMPESAAVADDGHHHLRIYDRFAKTLDPSRPTLFPPPGPANKIRGIFELRVGDIGDTHYSFNLAKDFLATGQVTNPRSWMAEMETTTREEARARGWSGVWFSSEYGIMNMMPDLLNAPYGSIIDDVAEEPLSGKNTQQVFLERLRREWGFMRSEPTCLGGAYFPWLCAAAGDNPWGWVVWGEDNDWGVVTADLLPKSFFWVMRALFSPVWFPERVTWRPGQTEIRFEVQNQYNAVDLRNCTLRTLMGWGLGMTARRWKDIPVACPPGESCTVTIPIWNQGTLEALSHGAACVCRCVLLDPQGFRPIMADIVIVPEKPQEVKAALAIGPDAVM